MWKSTGGHWYLREPEYHCAPAPSRAFIGNVNALKANSVCLYASVREVVGKSKDSGPATDGLCLRHITGGNP